ncbi:MAG: beta-lactamase family protein [Bacteroidaceae bacterium]|nr:beta-lactamase family protein [Bacteroidaceae bacterium]
MKRLLLTAALALGSAALGMAQSLPRTAPTPKMQSAFEHYWVAVKNAKMDMHSVMVIKDGKVVAEQWQSEGKPEVPHILNSVSKTFTSAAVGIAIQEGKLKLTDKLVSFFPDMLPANPSENLKAVTVRDLLTMNCGQETEVPREVRSGNASWIKAFLAHPFPYKPNTHYTYNSMGTYMLSAIVTKVTGEKVVDYLYPRLFKPLGIDKPKWDESPEGINTGGWGLYLKTEDLAKMGQLLLNKGVWNNQQIIPSWYVEEATSYQVPSVPSGTKPGEEMQKGLTLESSDWVQGYGYQTWQCRHGGFRADGANGQYIIVLPEKNAVIATTANVGDMQAEINLIWLYLLPGL